MKFCLEGTKALYYEHRFMRATTYCDNFCCTIHMRLEPWPSAAFGVEVVGITFAYNSDGPKDLCNSDESILQKRYHKRPRVDPLATMYLRYHRV